LKLSMKAFRVGLPGAMSYHRGAMGPSLMAKASRSCDRRRRSGEPAPGRGLGTTVQECSRLDGQFSQSDKGGSPRMDRPPRATLAEGQSSCVGHTCERQRTRTDHDSIGNDTGLCQ
jgi:hypothetical protein